MSARALQDDAILKAPADTDRPLSTDVEARPRASRLLPCRPVGDSRGRPRPHLLDPDCLPDYIDRLYRAAWALRGSRHDTEDLVQETFVKVLKRPRLLRDDNEIGYLLRALRNTYANRHRTAARRPATRQLFEDDAPRVGDSRINARDIMQAIATAPAQCRVAVIAVDLLGLSYREAARSLHTREAHEGQQVAGTATSLNLNTNRNAAAPSLIGGTTNAGANPVPWLTLQEFDGQPGACDTAACAPQIFVSHAVPATAGACAAGTKPNHGSSVGNFCFQQVGIDRVQGPGAGQLDA